MILNKVPFLRLLIPLIAGIILQYYLHSIDEWRYFFLISALLLIAISLYPSKTKQYTHRWIFGVGISLLTVFIGAASTAICQEQSEFTFPSEERKSYRAQITDAPQEKPKSTAFKVYLPDYDKRIICYVQTSLLSDELQVGDEFFFHSKIQPIKSYQNPDNFDYTKYMYNKGISGSTYIPANKWEASTNKDFSIKAEALILRQKIIAFYKSLDLDEHEFAMLSALTLGYKESLSDDITQSFRASGTAHILAISGLHVGIIYLVINSLFAFAKRGRIFQGKQILIILSLWIYVFIIGLPPSAIRAAIMLSLFCISQLTNAKRFSFNTISIAAFFMLLWNPFLLFDIGFQFSFSAVVFIIWLQPKAQNLVKTKNKILRFCWNTFSISCIAQLGTFPLALYYFGSFPTYFFLSNMLIIPLAMCFTYLSLLNLALIPFSFISDLVFFLPTQGIKLLVYLITKSVTFFEGLPFAYITDIKIDFTTLVLIFSITISSFSFLIYKKVKFLKLSMCCISALVITLIIANLNDKDKLSIYNNTEIRWSYAGEKHQLDSIDGHKLLRLKNIQLLFLSKDNWSKYTSDTKFEVDHLHLSENEQFSLYSLTQIFDIKNVILDSSLSSRTAKRLAKECQELGISCHDVKQNDAFHLFF